MEQPTNFIDYQFKTSPRKESVAMDAQVMRKHPDGSPCYAKKEEDCPIINNAKKTDNADDLGNVAATPTAQSKSNASQAYPQTAEGRHLDELYRSTLPQILKQVPGAESISYSQLEEAYADLQEQVANWKPEGKQIVRDTRKMRDDVFAKHKDAKYESFDLSTGANVTDADGKWGVTFHTTSAEKDMSGQDYDLNVAKFSDILGAKPQVGVYDGSCEISYACDSLTKSSAAMVMCEQRAIFGYMKSKTAVKPNEYGVDIVNFTFNRSVNDLEHLDRSKYL